MTRLPRAISLAPLAVCGLVIAFAFLAYGFLGHWPFPTGPHEEEIEPFAGRVLLGILIAFIFACPFGLLAMCWLDGRQKSSDNAFNWHVATFFLGLLLLFAELKWFHVWYLD